MFVLVMECNGNGLCFNYDIILFMCLFSKVICDCCYSFKGRVGLIREWICLLGKEGVDIYVLSVE